MQYSAGLVERPHPARAESDACQSTCSDPAELTRTARRGLTAEHRKLPSHCLLPPYGRRLLRGQLRCQPVDLACQLFNSLRQFRVDLYGGGVPILGCLYRGEGVLQVSLGPICTRRDQKADE